MAKVPDLLQRFHMDNRHAELFLKPLPGPVPNQQSCENQLRKISKLLERGWQTANVNGTMKPHWRK